jgi:phage-related protein
LYTPASDLTKAVTAALLVSCVLAPGLGQAPRRGEIVFQDDFRAKLGEGWQWVREDPAAWRIGKEGLEIRVQSGSSKRDFLKFPAAVKEDMGNALGIAQFGGSAPTAEPWKGLGLGVLEIVGSHDGNAYRAVYTVRLEKAVYVLHAFQKKSSSGIRTAK